MTNPCAVCRNGQTPETRGLPFCPACHRGYPPEAHEPRIFDGPTTVIPDRVKVSLGFDAGSEVRAFDVTGIRLVVLVTDADVGNAHMGGAASTEERIDILRQVLAGLEALQ